jgi:serine/threonine-protein kinase
LRADQTVAAVSPDPLFGLVLDEKYRLDARLGEGGMGTVYRAAHLLIDRPVAVKLLHPRFVEDEAAQQRFRREARAAGRLQHPNAVTVTDFGSTADGYVYLVMELLEGRTLRDVLSTEAPLAPGHAVELMSQIAAAVEAAHEAGVIHRDLKPGNIFVVQRKGSPPVLKVLDFGIAKLAAESTDESDSKNLTQTGVMIGTPRYMSPEQCDGERLTPASDVYSLGIILYEMLTGATPFNGPTPLAVALQHSSKPPRPPRELMPSIPAEFEQVVLHALAKSPAERPGDAGAFRRELLETARRLGLEHHPAAPHAPPVQTPPANGDDNNKAQPDKLVIDLERMREERAAAAAASAPPSDDADSGELTLLAGAGGHGKTAAATVAAAAPAGGAMSDLFPLSAENFTRFRVQMQKRNPWLNRVSQPTVLIAALLGALVFGVAVVGLFNPGGADEAVVSPADNANAPGPSPSPEATPSARPAPQGGAAKQPARRRQTAARPANVRPQKKSGNRVKRALKKIFNPF